MKLFISADIEGCVGTTLSAETHKNEAVYQAFAREMTAEVAAVCEAALEAGAEEIVVKDGHGDATNIDFTALPEEVTLIRGKSGHPINMMFGLDESFDAVLYVGYHAPAGCGGNPISHTSTGNSNSIYLNGKLMSEFMLNTYTAAYYGVPAVFISGDRAICDLAKEMVPAITTAAVKEGVGASTINMSPAAGCRLLKKQVKEALSGDLSACRIPMPEQFEYVVNYKDINKAYKMSFFPGVERVDDRTNRLVSRDYMDIVTAHSFIVY